MPEQPDSNGIRRGLNRSGLFFEELVANQLIADRRFSAIKEERPYAYTSELSHQTVAGTIDFVGFYYRDGLGGRSNIFAIECKKVNTAKTWLFASMREDGFSTVYDRPDYLLKMELNENGGVSKRRGAETHISPEKFSIKSYELRENGNVYHNNEEKVFNAARQAVRAVNGLYLDDEEVGLEIFNRPNVPQSIYYCPMVLTNAQIAIADIDTATIDSESGEISANNGFAVEFKGWTYYVLNLMPEERQPLSMRDSNGELISVKPLRMTVPVVNINHLDDFIESFNRISGL